MITVSKTILCSSSLLVITVACKGKDDDKLKTPTPIPVAVTNSVQALDLSNDSALTTLKLVLPYNAGTPSLSLTDGEQGGSGDPCNFGTMECRLWALFGDPDVFGAGSGYNGFAITDLVGMPNMKSCAIPLTTTNATLALPGSDRSAKFACAATPTADAFAANLAAKNPNFPPEELAAITQQFKIAVAWGKEDTITRFLTVFSITPPSALLGGDGKNESQGYIVSHDSASGALDAFGISASASGSGMSRTNLLGNSSTKLFQFTRTENADGGHIMQYKAKGKAAGDDAHYLVRFKVTEANNLSYSFNGTTISSGTEYSYCVVAATGAKASDDSACATYATELDAVSYIDTSDLPTAKFEPVFKELQ